MTRATLEGIESCNDSPGLGLLVGWYDREPTIGERFVFSREEADGWTNALLTTAVQGVRRMSETEIRFRTRNTTYVLRLEEAR